jgi:lactate dehydrogenase-like 2-hydroxyacid dehydrogenase
VIQHGRLVPAVEKRLAEEFDVVPIWQQEDPAAWLQANAAGHTALVGSARVGVDAGIIEALPALRVIASFGVGYDTIDVAAAKRRSVAVSYTPDVLNDCVADLAWGAMLDISRGLSEADRFMRRGDWMQRPFRLATRLNRKKLGIVGLGRIGRAIARRGQGFDMEIRYHNRRPVEGVEYRYMDDLKALARWSDFLMIAVAGGAEHPAPGVCRCHCRVGRRRLPDQCGPGKRRGWRGADPCAAIPCHRRRGARRLCDRALLPRGTVRPRERRPAAAHRDRHP